MRLEPTGRNRRRSLAGVAIAIAAASCSQGPAGSTTPVVPERSAAASSSIASLPPDPLRSPAVVGSFAVDATGRKLTVECWGFGSPTVILEGGDGSIEQFRNGTFARRIAEQTQICLYDHAGRGTSDAAPNKPREAEDLASDLHALLKAAKVSPPYVLVGSSFGGMVVTFDAQAWGDEVVGVVTLDTPAPQANLTEADFPDSNWDSPGNDEHLNVRTGFENRFGKQPVRFNAPLIVVVASAGQSTMADQRYWMQTSSRATEVGLSGGHEIYRDQPEQVADLVLMLVHGEFPSSSGAQSPSM